MTADAINLFARSVSLVRMKLKVDEMHQFNSATGSNRGGVMPGICRLVDITHLVA